MLENDLIALQGLFSKGHKMKGFTKRFVIPEFFEQFLESELGQLSDDQSVTDRKKG